VTRVQVTTFGEALFRLSTHAGDRLERATELAFHLGGSELNIAANLASLGVHSRWVSCLPDGATGELMRARLEHLGIDLGHCQVIPGGRPGWYLMDAGSAPRPDVVLGRFASSLQELKSFRLNWDQILQGTALFHTSGITAGLSTALTQEVERAMTAARARGLLVSYDFNLRRNIWSEDDFVSRQKPLLPLIDILFCSEQELSLFFGRPVGGEDFSSVFAASKLQLIVLTERREDSSCYGVRVVTPKGTFHSRMHAFEQLDRIGVGDSMAAGFVARYLETKDPASSAEWAAAAGALKYSIKGDMALLKRTELERLVGGSKGIVR
jgi:2-dehydro-3-deoxygluconokinase